MRNNSFLTIALIFVAACTADTFMDSSAYNPEAEYGPGVAPAHVAGPATGRGEAVAQPPRLPTKPAAESLSVPASVTQDTQEEHSALGSQPSSEVQSVARFTIPGTSSAADETCTETFGVCKVGQCELGPNDTFQRITEVCCTAGGSCTTELYRLCGC
jgi:hypothetical protein